MSVTAQRRLFITEYLKDLDAPAACARAGLQIGNAGVIMADPAVREVIYQSVRVAAERGDISPDGVLARINEVANRCMQSMPVLDKEGNETGEYRFDSAGALKALELLGKHLALFTEKHEHTHTGAVMVITGVPVKTVETVAVASEPQSIDPI